MAAEKPSAHAEKPFRPPPSGDIKQKDALGLVEALHGARLTLHCALLGERAKGDAGVVGSEVIGETLAEIQEALRLVYGDEPIPPICSGCSPLTIERHGFQEGR